MYDSPRSTVVIWVVAAALAVFALTRLLGGGHDAAPPVSIDGAARSSHAQDQRADLYVHVAGAVRRPGLMRLRSGTRVATALERAGGPTSKADLTLVNLAAPLQDGQQIVVPRKGGAQGVAGAAATAGAVSGAQVHLATATAEQLDEIDGIGPTLAERIVEYRDAHGGFRSLEELAQVEGIGEKRLATLRDALQP
jgi:competence protein ComEA